MTPTPADPPPPDSLIHRIGRALTRLPPPVRAGLRRLAFGGKARHCPLCHRSARLFLPAGRRGERRGAMCPWCGSLERHRFVWLYIQRHTRLLRRPGLLLHVAPEPAMEQAVERAGGVAAVTSDLDPEGVDVAADLTRLCFRDAVFDWVYCSHVLEHIPADRQAMREIHRVLRPGGTAVIQVPIREGPTYEDPTVTRPEDRLAVFGQEDHVRYYGPDVTERLEDAGFRVTTVRVADLVTAAEAKRHGLIADDLLFRCDRDG